MTTALALINRAAELIGYKDPDETLGAADQASFLAALNSMLDSWNTQRLFVFAVEEVSQSVSGLPITIGPGGTIVRTMRPTKVEDGSFIRISSVDYGIQWITQDQYNSISVKSQDGPLACYGYYDPAMPLGKLYLWPYPLTAVELHLQLQTPLSSFATTATDVTLAPGYQRAIEYSLAEELAPGRRPTPAEVQRIAATARKAIRRLNVEDLVQDVSPRGTSPYANFIAGL